MKNEGLLAKAVILILILLIATAAAYANSSWTLQFPNGTGGIRVGHSAVYDPATNTMIVFGGINGLSGSNDVVVNDVFLLSHANGLGGTGAWSQLIPNGNPGSPLARTSASAVYDSANNRMIVFGGCSWTGDLCTQRLNDVWVLTNANGQGGVPAWSRLLPSGSLPPARWGQVAAYDVADNRLIVYGGEDRSTFSDVWVLTHANGLGGTPAWTHLTPGGATPLARSRASAVYDDSNNILIVFGGNSGVVTTNGVWTLSHANGLGGTPQWSNIVADGIAGSPGKRDGHTAVYDPTSNRMIIFGGDRNNVTGFPQYNDVWVLMNANGISGTPAWIKLSPSGTKPAGRVDHTAVYDPANNRLIIDGGESFDGLFLSVWIVSGANGL
jgi:hypothetical protein